jgi:hypothetical protein
MRRRLIWVCVLCSWAAAYSAQAGGRLIKVLPQYLDLKGRNSRTPSLYDRDAYQAQLREHPEQCSGIRFYIQWKSKKPVWEPLKLRVEARGFAKGDVPKQLVLETPVQPTGWFGHWDPITVTGDQYKEFGGLTAWRVTLWEGEQLLSEQKSFLW